MMKTNNYNDYDKLTIYVKKDKVDAILQKYEVFSWEVEDKKENSRYDDILDVTFCRPHKIPYKDELQLMQVYMEEEINTLAKKERHKHNKSTAVGLGCGLPGLAILVFGILNFFKLFPPMGLIVGILCTVIGLGATIFTSFVLPKMVKTENADFLGSCKTHNANIDKICNQVKTLLGGDDDAKRK